MKLRVLICLLISLTVASFSFAQVTVVGDTTFITGGTFSGGENAGLLETTINGDNNGTDPRIHPNQVYALYEGQVYYQLAPIDVYNSTGTLTIVGVPDPANPSAKTKPIVIIQPTLGVPVSLAAGAATNEVYGSVKFVNVHYQTMQTDGTQNGICFLLGTQNELPQSLTIDKCLFEFMNTDLFNATAQSGSIGGWGFGAKFKITNSYFRNFFNSGQWWNSRVFQCKFPVDTLWVENCTVTTGGLTFLQQNQLTDVTYINHNTIINNKKYWLLSPYRRELFVTNNIFVNQNWVGEDFNVTNSGQDPDKVFMSTINIDTNARSNANGFTAQPKYWVNGVDSVFTADLNFDHMKVYISNNINYNSPELASGYYNNATYVNATLSALPSSLNWAGQGSGPWAIGNVPGQWMNERTQALFTQYAPPNGGFVEEHTITTQPQTSTSLTLDADEVQAMAQWNQNQWSDSRFSAPTPNILDTKYIYGDYLSTTLPGIVSGTKSDAVTGEAVGTQVGITKFTDLTENFSQSTDISTIDQLPIGALIWDDNQIANYNSEAALQAVKARYASLTGIIDITSGIPQSYSLIQNYPNPFNPSTKIEFSLPQSENVTLKIFNLLGQEVATLVNENMGAGTYRVDFDASKLSSGLYIYKIEAGSFTSSKKMMFLK